MNQEGPSTMSNLDELRDALQEAALDAHVGWSLWETRKDGATRHTKEWDECQVSACKHYRSILLRSSKVQP